MLSQYTPLYNVQDDTVREASLGSFLVRESIQQTNIPESNIIALLASGLIGLVLSRRKKYQV